jgi:DNA-binding NarL/FixJ family response regulator
MSFQFQPARATEATVLIALIDRRLCMARRRQHRYQRHLKRIQKQMEFESCCPDAVETGHAERINRNCDIWEIVARLDPKDQQLCRMLSAGESIEAIAGQLECGWHTVKRRIDRLRQVFEEMGMDGCSD